MVTGYTDFLSVLTILGGPMGPLLCISENKGIRPLRLHLWNNKGGLDEVHCNVTLICIYGWLSCERLSTYIVTCQRKFLLVGKTGLKCLDKSIFLYCSDNVEITLQWGTGLFIFEYVKKCHTHRKSRDIIEGNQMILYKG